MSIDIRITQKGLRKKTLPLEVITGGTLVLSLIHIYCRQPRVSKENSNG